MVECAKLCVKSEVIYHNQIDVPNDIEFGIFNPPRFFLTEAGNLGFGRSLICAEEIRGWRRPKGHVVGQARCAA